MLATHHAQLWDPAGRFSLIGSLYLTSFVDGDRHVSRIPLTPDDGMPLPVDLEGIDPDEFNTGRAMDPSFFSERRRYIPSDRSPYLSEIEWLSAGLRIEHTFLETAEDLFETRNDRLAEYDSETWSNLEDEIGTGDCSAFLDEYNSITDACDQYREILPSICQADQKHQPSSFVLYRSDLCLPDILVDELIHKITGIIDWGGTLRSLPG